MINVSTSDDDIINECKKINEDAIESTEIGDALLKWAYSFCPEVPQSLIQSHDAVTALIMEPIPSYEAFCEDLQTDRTDFFRIVNRGEIISVKSPDFIFSGHFQLEPKPFVNSFLNSFDEFLDENEEFKNSISDKILCLLNTSIKDLPACMPLLEDIRNSINKPKEDKSKEKEKIFVLEEDVLREIIAVMEKQQLGNPTKDRSTPIPIQK